MSNLFDWLVEHEPNFRKSRLPSLYSDLAQQKSSNPDGFIANATAWQTALTQAALAGQLPAEQKIILRTSTDLLNALSSPHFGQPTGLGVVLDEAVKNGRFMNLKDYNGAEHSIYQKSWLPSPWTVLKWGLRQAGLASNTSYDSAGRLREGQLVLVEALEQVAKQILAQQSSQGQGVVDRVMSRDVFAQQLLKTEIGSLNPKEIEILLRFLSRDKQILCYDSNTVKFKSPSAENPEPITEEDSSIASIKALIASLDSQIAVLNTRIANLQSTAQAAVQSKNKNTALSALRSKKLAERNLEQRTNTLYQLEEVFTKVEQAVDQVQIMEVMQSSAATLKSLNNRVGGVDKVDAVMDDLREQMNQVDEVGQILQEPLDGKAIDETAVDDEFEAMEKEELAREEELKADATRARLAELDQAETMGKEKVAKSAETKPYDDIEAELLSSSDKLERLQLNDHDEKTAERNQGKEKLQLEAM